MWPGGRALCRVCSYEVKSLARRPKERSIWVLGGAFSVEEHKRVRFYLHEKQHEASPHAIFMCLESQRLAPARSSRDICCFCRLSTTRCRF